MKASLPPMGILRRAFPLIVVAILGTPGLIAQESTPSTNAAPNPRPAGAQSGGRPRRPDAFERFDRNGDGRVTAEEINNPAMLQWLDRDGDGAITRQEAAEALTEIGGRGRWARPTSKGTNTASAPVKPAPETKESFWQVADAPLGVGRRLEAGVWTSLDGRQVNLDARPTGKGRILLATSSSCPLSRKYGPSLGRLATDAAAQGFEVVFIAPVESDSKKDLKAMADAQKWTAPLLPDPKGDLSRRLGLRSTTEAIVTDAAGTVVYRGAVDDQYGLGYAKAEPTRRPLRDALEAVLRGERPAIAATTAPGCDLESAGPIPVSTGRTVTFHNRVSRILQTHCQECHQTGGPAPFELESYTSVVGHAKVIQTQVEKGIMPPWFAAPDPAASAGHTPWLNDRSLPDEDRRDLLGWLSGQRPEGNLADAPLPLPAAGDWSIGKPDAVYTIPKPIAVSAEGVMPYQKTTIETGLTEDQWVTAVEIQPTAKAVVHHVLVFVRQPGQRGRGDADSGGDGVTGFFAAYVPGNTFQIYPEGFAKPLPAGSRLRFQIHYTPNGTAVEDQMRIGFRFAKEPPRHRIHVVGIANPMLRIPPGAPNHEESASLPVPRDARILALMPHLHVRGKAFRFELLDADGGRKPLLDVPRYDFNWQLSYRFEQPVTLPSGTRIRATAWYDNSPANPANPDPTQEVRWGEQTFEEMMLGYVEYYLPDAGI